ncbi:MAG: AbrB/MazE/SpoVT family DNA-binding domain-containing protein [Clostridia bacterium]|nr:AbrB/MazE/SpoVT family DNA-binding domain-containing protein [Clostridia bacterium]
MKATGIVRRIDDLGRVVIPKEIRRTMRIREGDPLEIYTDREGEVIFKKYSPIGELAEFSSQYAETLYKTCGLAVAICDRDAVIACAGIPKKEYVDKKLSFDVEQLIEERSLYYARMGEEIPLTESGVGVVNCMMPILTEGDITGSVVSLRRSDGESITADVETKLIQTAAGFLGRQLES